MARLRFTSSEVTNADLCFSRKGSHANYYIIDLIKTVLLINQLTNQSASNKLFHVGMITKFRFSKFIFTEDKIR